MNQHLYFTSTNKRLKIRDKSQYMEISLSKPESFTHLGLCIHKGEKYYLKSVSLQSLFGNDSRQHDAHGLIKKVYSWKFPHYFYGMGFLRVKDGPLYVVAHGSGSDEREMGTEPKHNLVMHKYDISPNQESFSIINEQPTSPMESRWKQVLPILVEINRKIYVLSQFCHPEQVATVFQSYDPSEDKWTILDPPPILKFTTGDMMTMMNYIVVHDKLCVQMLRYSCAFNTETKTWEECMLFKNPKLLRKLDFELDPRGKEVYYNAPSLPYDSPMWLSSAIVIYQKFLMFTIGSSVAAYKIKKNGKLSSTGQTLFKGGYQLESAGHFVELGDGYFCLFSMTDFDYCCPESPSELQFVKFKVTIAEDGKGLLPCNEDEVEISTVTYKHNREHVLSVFAC